MPFPIHWTLGSLGGLSAPGSKKERRIWEKLTVKKIQKKRIKQSNTNKEQSTNQNQDLTNNAAERE
jgi:hypothetical protein